MFRRLFAVAALVSCAASPVLAQGRQSGGIAGRVSSADQRPLPGASVSAASPALQGQRSAVSDVNGVFRIPGLPPGDYVVTIEMSGMTTVERRATVPLGGDVVIEQSLAVAA
ncbi:MAG TPA: carboxypeptidase-like regulatory domain-containing protein, partial [Vicinamibacterales bacterium]|nr:carboxypeptidase-like regulatory domain-containing protein [Vicinamibacterales bacterium]